MDEVTPKTAEINKVRDRINRYLQDTLMGMEDVFPLDAIFHTVQEYFRDLTGDTAPNDLEKPCESPTKPHIVIEVLGGCVTDVTSDSDFTYEVKDYDNDPDLDDKDA